MPERVLAAIQAFIDDHGYAPTCREISDATGLSLGGTHFALTSLRRQRLIRWDSVVARSISLTTPRESLLRLLRLVLRDCEAGIGCDDIAATHGLSASLIQQLSSLLSSSPRRAASCSES